MKTERTPNTRVAVAARLTSEALGPAPLGSVLLICAALSAGATVHNLLAGGLAVLFVTAGPMIALLYLSRCGRVSDHHVSERSQRAPVLAGVFGCMAVGTWLLYLWGSPVSLYRMLLGLALGLLVVMVVNLFWKLSIHAAVAAFFVLSICSIFGLTLIWTAVVPAAVGWSRVQLKAHSMAQVVAGWGVGCVVGSFFAWTALAMV